MAATTTQHSVETCRRMVSQCCRDCGSSRGFYASRGAAYRLALWERDLKEAIDREAGVVHPPEPAPEIIFADRLTHLDGIPIL